MKTPAHLYRERGALIEAMQLTGVPPDGTNIDEVFDWMREGNTPGKGLPVECFPMLFHTAGDDLLLVIHAPGRKWEARVGDWIIRNSGHPFGLRFSTQTDDEFEATYEVVE